MPPKKKKPDLEKFAQFVAQTKRERDTRDEGYRERALALFPHVCGRCGREFSGKNMRELTVHHKDHNHKNNPPDGSNWELLCLYCHDDEHQIPQQREGYDGHGSIRGSDPTLFSNPFEGLGDLLKPEDEDK